MKKTFLIIALVAMSTVASFAQGTINPLNGALTRVKIDLNGDGVGDRNATAQDGLQVSAFRSAASFASVPPANGRWSPSMTAGRTG